MPALTCFFVAENIGLFLVLGRVLVGRVYPHVAMCTYVFGPARPKGRARCGLLGVECERTEPELGLRSEVAGVSGDFQEEFTVCLIDESGALWVVDLGVVLHHKGISLVQEQRL